MNDRETRGGSLMSDARAFVHELLRYPPGVAWCQPNGCTAWCRDIVAMVEARDARESSALKEELRAEIKAHVAHHEHDNAEVKRLGDDAEQLRVQLAGVSVAAMGGTSLPQVATPDMYGWSRAYQDVLDLRIKYDAIRGAAPAAHAEIEMLRGDVEMLRAKVANPDEQNHELERALAFLRDLRGEYGGTNVQARIDAFFATPKARP